MARGITITITRQIERRERRVDEIGLRIWTGTCWRRADSLPYSPDLADIYGCEPEEVSTTIEFLPFGGVPHDALLYRETLLRNMRAQGVIK